MRVSMAVNRASLADAKASGGEGVTLPCVQSLWHSPCAPTVPQMFIQKDSKLPGARGKGNGPGNGSAIAFGC